MSNTFVSRQFKPYWLADEDRVSQSRRSRGMEELMGAGGVGGVCVGRGGGVSEAESQRREGGTGLKRLFGGGGIKPDLQRCID